MIDPSLSSAPPSPDHDAVDALIRHFDPAVKAAYLRLRENRLPEDARIVIDAIVGEHLPHRPEAMIDLTNDRLNLINDLGLDSVAIAELVFFIEDLFLVKISNQEILNLHTIGDLRGFVRQKLASLPPPGK